MSHSSILAAKTRADQAFIHAQIAEGPASTSKSAKTKTEKVSNAIIYAELTHILSDLQEAQNKADDANRSIDVITALNAGKLRDEYLALREKWVTFTLKHYGRNHPYCPKFYEQN